MFEKVTGKRWYIQSFNGTPIMIHMAGVSGTRNLFNTLGYGYDMIVTTYENDFCEFYYDHEDLHRLAHEIEARYRKDKNYLKGIIRKSEEDRDQMYNFIKKNVPKIESLSDEELLNTYKEMIESYIKVAGTNHVVEGYTLTRDTILKNLLTAHLESIGRGKELKDLFMALTAPTRIPFISDYENHLIKAHESGDSTGLKDFYWIKANYLDAPRIDDFSEDIEKVKDFEYSPEEEFERNAKEKEKLIRDLELPNNITEIVRITDVLSGFHDDRKKYILHGCVAVQEFLKEISKRFGLPLHDLKYLLPDEIDKIPEIDAEFLSRKKKGLLVIYDKDGYKRYEFGDYDLFKEEMSKKEENHFVKEIAGMTASLGKVIGPVRICKTLGDIHNFKKGEVLVTGMTRPEFIVAMKKAVAIVTDEGGITSHAAVISRELKVPCVIGTKIATKVLKDGQLVEVNANHGMITIKDDI